LVLLYVACLLINSPCSLIVAYFEIAFRFAPGGMKSAMMDQAQLPC
jgi:hypothetical protein